MTTEQIISAKVRQRISAFCKSPPILGLYSLSASHTHAHTNTNIRICYGEGLLIQIGKVPGELHPLS